MAENRFLEKAIHFEVQKVRYQAEQERYLVLASSVDRGSWKTFQTEWLYIPAFDAEYRDEARRTQRSPQQEVALMNQMIERLKSSENKS